MAKQNKNVVLKQKKSQDNLFSILRKYKDDYLFMLPYYTVFFLFSIFPVLISIFYNRTVDLAETETGIIHLSYNALLTACFFSSLLLINPVFMRVLQYYSLLLLILLPEGARIFGKGKGRMFYGLCCTLLMLALFVSEKRFYEFFWQ